MQVPPPAASQRSQRYANLNGSSPVHVPGVATSDERVTGVPSAVGGVLFTGGGSGVFGVPPLPLPLLPFGAAATTFVAFELADAPPTASVAVTRTRIVAPTSPEPRT